MLMAAVELPSPDICACDDERNNFLFLDTPPVMSVLLVEFAAIISSLIVLADEMNIMTE